MSSALAEIARLDSTRSSLLLEVLQQQASAITTLTSQVAELSGWREVADEDIAALRAEVRELRTTSTGVSTGSAAGTPSIVIRSATGALAARRRLQGATATPNGDESASSILGSAEGFVIELINSRSSDAPLGSPACAFALPRENNSSTCLPADVSASPPSHPSPFTPDSEALREASPSAVKVACEPTLAGVDAPPPVSLAESFGSGRPASEANQAVETRWPGTPHQTIRTRRPASRGGGRSFVSAKPQPLLRPRSLGGSSPSTPQAVTPASYSSTTTSPSAAKVPDESTTPQPPLPQPCASSTADRSALSARLVAARPAAAGTGPLCAAESLGSGDGPVTCCLALSADGQCLVSGCEDGSLHLWTRGRAGDSNWGHALTMMAGPENDGGDRAVNALALRGTLLLTASGNGAVWAWRAGLLDEEPEDGDDEPDGELYPLRSFQQPPGAGDDVAGVQCVALPPEGKPPGTAPRHSGGARATAAESAESAEWALPRAFAVSGGQDNSLCVWDTETGELLQHEVFKAWVMAVSIGYAPDGRPLVLSASADGECVVWQARRHVGQLAHLSGSEPPLERCRVLHARPKGRLVRTVRAAKLSADGAHAALGFDDGTLLVWDGLAGREVDRRSRGSGAGEKPYATKLPPSEGGSAAAVGALEWRGGEIGGDAKAELVVGAESGEVMRWTAEAAPAEDACTFQCAQVVPPGSRGEVYALACARTGEVLAGTADGKIHCLRSCSP